MSYNLKFTDMLKKNFLFNMLTIVMFSLLSVGFASCGGDGEDQSKLVNQKSMKETIVGEWVFNITPYEGDRRSLIVFFDNGMFYEQYGSTIDRYHHSGEPGFYTVKGNELKLKSCNATGGFYSDNLSCNNNQISEGFITLSVDNYIYEGERSYNSQFQNEKDDINYRKIILGKWKCSFKHENHEADYEVVFKNNGTFEFTDRNKTYNGIYGITNEWIMLYEPSAECPLNDLYVIPSSYVHTDEQFQIWYYYYSYNGKTSLPGYITFYKH